MIYNILVVDDNQPFLNLITKIFDKYQKKYQLYTCLDGVQALDVLTKKDFAVVVSDLQMPNMDGYALLKKINEQFPDIPVIVITAFDKPKTESVIKKTGAYAYFTKPLVIEDLLANIESIVAKETEGGRLHNASLEMFIQLIEMEAKTCTIRVFNEEQNKTGVLFFNNGTLFQARYGALKGKKAAYEVFSWDKVTLSIENKCIVENRQIKDELQAILLDAMRMKDEIGASEEEFSEEPENNAAINAERQDQQAASSVNDTDKNLIQWEEKSIGPEDVIKNKLNDILNTETDIISLNLDAPFTKFIEQSNALGSFLDIGNITAAFFDENGSGGTYLVPVEDDKCIELVIGAKCSPDKIIKSLTE